MTSSLDIKPLILDDMCEGDEEVASVAVTAVTGGGGAGGGGARGGGAGGGGSGKGVWC
jgi:hypothetical protein